MRQVILDTETTGLNPATGDRIIEIGCVEMFDRRLTERTFHYYVNPERDIDAGAFAVHGLSREFLSDKPVFGNIVEQLIEFVDGAEIVIHNAAFDLGFLDNEFALLKRPPFRNLAAKITDTLLDARQMFPGKRNSLDALCERFSISNQHRTLHGALLDAQLLAEVYVAMTRGQEDLSIDLIDYTVGADASGHTKALPTDLKALVASDDDIAQHEKVGLVDLYHKKGMDHAKLVHFKWLKDPSTGAYKKYKYPDFIDVPFNTATDEYPYPEKAIQLTYDGLHPSDKGYKRIAHDLIREFQKIK